LSPGGISYHEKWRNDPIQYYTERHLHPDIFGPKNMMERFEFDFAQYWVHHHQQTDR
jgi:hypothetical protein